MNDFLGDLLAGEGPRARDVTYNGQTGVIYFKRISAGQRANLLKGQHAQITPGEKSVFEVDLGQSTITKHMLVQYSVCNEDGTPRFRNLEQVQKADSLLIETLYEHASAVNSEGDDDTGKS